MNMMNKKSKKIALLFGIPLFMTLLFYQIIYLMAQKIQIKIDLSMLW